MTLERLEQATGKRLELEQATTASGDVCHYHLKGLTDAEGKEIWVADGKPPNIAVCVDGEPTFVTQEELEKRGQYW